MPVRRTLDGFSWGGFSWGGDSSDSTEKNICNENRLADVAAVYLASFLGSPINLNSFLDYELDPNEDKDYPYYSGKSFKISLC